MSGEKLTALYSFERGMVACVLLQAVYGGDRRVVHLFADEDWIVAPCDSLRSVTATLDEWREVAAMSKDDRISLLHQATANKTA